jgi:hypothetical protein
LRLRGDIYYRLDRNEILKAEFASFASKRLDSLIGDDSCTFKNNPDNSGLSARLLRGYPSELKNNPEEFRSSRDFVAELKGLEYYYPVTRASPPITCLTNHHEEFNDVEQSISNQLQEAFRRLELVDQQ